MFQVGERRHEHVQAAVAGLDAQGGMDHLDPLSSLHPVVGRFLLPVFRMGLRLALEAAVAAGHLP